MTYYYRIVHLDNYLGTSNDLTLSKPQFEKCHKKLTMGLQCLISSHFSSNPHLSNFHTPIPSRNVYSIFEWSITLLVLGLRHMINLQKKTLKLLLEIQNDLKRFYRSNDPESVLVIDSVNKEEELEEMEENLKDRDYRKRLVSPISLHML